MFLRKLENVLKAVIAGSSGGVAFLGAVALLTDVLPIISFSVESAHMYTSAALGAVALTFVSVKNPTQEED